MPHSPFLACQVRLQLQNISGPGVVHKYKGPLGTLATILREEGVSAPFKVCVVWCVHALESRAGLTSFCCVQGLTPGLHRAFIFTGIRLGLYVRPALELANLPCTSHRYSQLKPGRSTPGTCSRMQTAISALRGEQRQRCLPARWASLLQTPLMSSRWAPAASLHALHRALSTCLQPDGRQHTPTAASAEAAISHALTGALWYYIELSCNTQVHDQQGAGRSRSSAPTSQCTATLSV